MSVVRRYENALSTKVKQSDLFELLKNWIQTEFSSEENSLFSKHILNSGIHGFKNDDTFLIIQTVHYIDEEYTPYNDDYFYKLQTVIEDKNLFIEESGYIAYKNNEWICSIKTEAMPNDQQKEQNCENFDFTPSFLKYCQKEKKLGTNLGFRITNRPVRLRWEDFEEVNHLLNQDVLFYKPITLLRITNEDILKKAIDGLKINTAVWIDDDPDLFEDLKQDEKLSEKIPEEDTISYYPPFGVVSKYSVKNDSDVNDAIADIKKQVGYYHVENCILQYNYDDAVNFRRNAEIESFKSTIDELKRENAGLKKDIGELKLLTKQKMPVSVGKITKTGKTKTTVNIAKEPLLFNGKLNELYDGEIKDIVRSSLEEYRNKYVQDGTRRADILDSILIENKSNGVCNQKAKELEEALKNYDCASPKNIAALEKIGFKVKSKTNHLKLQWYEPKYTYTMATTPSDINANENNIHNIVKMFL